MYFDGLISALCIQGSLVGVCGGVGSGKSSLLSALLGQVRHYMYYHSKIWGFLEISNFIQQGGFRLIKIVSIFI